jgi:hypothetical protein
MRKARLISPGAIYRVAARTNRKELLLESSLAKELLLETLARARLKDDLQIDNSTIISKHSHPLIRLWGSRCNSRAISSFGEHLHVHQRIELDSVKAGLVDDPPLGE